MSKLLQDSAFFCLAISLIGYEIGIILRQKTKLALCNPLLISIVFVIIILKVTNIKYEVYEDGSSLLSYLLTPSTVCLAIPLHQQMGLLKKNMKAILAGILSGVFTSLAGVWVFSMLFHLDKKICFRSLSRQRSEWESLRSLVESLRSPLQLSSLPESSEICSVM